MVLLRKSQAFGCTRTLIFASLLLPLAASGGCQTATGTGALTGAGLGTGIGALAGHCPGAAVAGGLIGAAAGALTGAAVDAHRENKAERAVEADVAMRAPSLEDIVKLTQSAVPPGQIVEQIRTSGVVYRLTPDQLLWLNQQGVHQDVIREMQDSVYRGPRRVYVQQPVYVEPVGVGVGVGFGYGGGCRRW